jgi:hypothetical protein
MPDIKILLYFAEQTDPLQLDVRTSDPLTLQRIVAYSDELHLGQINLVAPGVQSGQSDVDSPKWWNIALCNHGVPVDLACEGCQRQSPERGIDKGPCM